MMNEMFISIANYISNNILKQPLRTISPDEPLISSGMIDSFSLVDIAIFVEGQFGVRIDDTELNADSFDSLNELVELILSRN